MKKLLTFLLSLALIASVCLSGCNKKDPYELDDSDVYVAFTVDETYAVNAETTLFDYLDCLAGDGKLTYSVLDSVSGKMITEVNGMENKGSDFWIIYTSDEELSNTAVGLVKLNGKTLGWADFGGDKLIVKMGETYVLYYQHF